MKTVVFTHGGGRFGNQLIRFIHWIAWTRSARAEVEVVNLAFWPYAELFELWSRNPSCTYPLRPAAINICSRARAAAPEILKQLSMNNDRLGRTIHRLGSLLPCSQGIVVDSVRKDSIDLEDPEFYERVATHRYTFCCGWRIASWNLVAQNEAWLRTLFQPTADWVARGRQFVSRLRTGCDVLIGVFVRHTDYATWHEGRFYFAAEQYAIWMRELIVYYAGVKVSFVVASDAAQPTKAFERLPCHFASGSMNAGGHWFSSWVELSMCDLILSPPSTFSATAAFAGGVPLCPVGRRDESLAQGFDRILNITDAARHPLLGLAVQ